MKPGRHPLRPLGDRLRRDRAVVEGDGGLQLVIGHRRQQRRLQGSEAELQELVDAATQKL